MAWSDPSIGIPRRLMRELLRLIESVTYFAGEDAIPGYDEREKAEFVIAHVMDEYVRGYFEDSGVQAATRFVTAMEQTTKQQNYKMWR